MTIRIVATLCAALLYCGVGKTAFAQDIYFKVCQSYQSGQYRNCNELKNIEFRDFGSIVLHVYSDLTWPLDSPRVQSDIYMRWIHRSPDNEIKIVANSGSTAAYRWRPSTSTPLTRWHVQATVWQDNPGAYIFQAYTNPANPENSLLKEILVPVEIIEGENLNGL